MTGRISELFPIVSTTDLERSLGFYRDVVAGVVSFSYPGSEGAIVYVGVDLGSSHLGIGLAPDRDTRSGQRTISLWVYADDCDGLVERVRSAGGTVIE
jgi:lactoylglutathione lyase